MDVRFAGRFLAWWLVLVWGAALVPGLDSWARSTTAAQVAWLLGAAPPVSAAPDLVSWAGILLKVDPECTSIAASSLLSAAILATPAPWFQHLAGVVGGAALLWLANLARILVLAFVLHGAAAAFDFVHQVVWQVVTMACVVSLFVVWRQRIDGHATP